MDVGIFTDNSDSMKNFLENPPDWLKKVGDDWTAPVDSKQVKGANNDTVSFDYTFSCGSGSNNGSFF